MSYICNQKREQAEKKLSEREKFARWTTIPQRAFEAVRELEKRQKRKNIWM